MSLVLIAGVIGPGAYMTANIQEYNGKAEARRKGTDTAHWVNASFSFKYITYKYEVYNYIFLFNKNRRIHFKSILK